MDEKKVAMKKRRLLYRVRLEPYIKGVRHTIPDSVDNLTQINGSTYLFNEMVNAPRSREDNNAEFHITRAITRRLPTYALTYESYGDGSLFIQAERLS